MCVPRASQMTPKNDLCHTSGPQFPGFAVFRESVILNNPPIFWHAFTVFRCHFFGVVAVRDPIKQTPVAEVVQGRNFNMFFSEK